MRLIRIGAAAAAVLLATAITTGVALAERTKATDVVQF